MHDWGRPEVVDAAGTRMHAAVLGEPGAPDVVCVHGLGCSHRYFGPLADRLAPHARVAAPDLPGFGRTPGPREALDVRGLSLALACWLRVTGRAGAVLVANSAGCQVVADLAVHAPELLGPVVLNGPTMDRHARSAWRQLVRLLADARRERPALGLVLARDYLACGPRRWLRTFRHFLADPVERKLPHLRVPTIVARGSGDTTVPRAWAEEVVALLPDGRLTEVPGAGHTLNYSAPAELAAIVRTLLPRGSAAVSGGVRGAHRSGTGHHSKEATVIGELETVVLDTRDPKGLATFYAQLLGARIVADEEDWVSIMDDQGRKLSFQTSPRHQAPKFPDPAGSQQFHLDLRVTDVDVAEQRVLGLGATRVPDATEDGTFRVFRDPAGHPFCLVWD